MNNCKSCYHYHMCDLQYRIEKDQECKHFKDTSLIIELPCKVGDEVYNIESLSIRTLKVVSIHLSDEGSIRRKKYKSHFIAIEKNSKMNGKFKLDSFGTTTFRTYEEAEKKLKERENETKT